MIQRGKKDQFRQQVAPHLHGDIRTWRSARTKRIIPRLGGGGVGRLAVQQDGDNGLCAVQLLGEIYSLQNAWSKARPVRRMPPHRQNGLAAQFGRNCPALFVFHAACARYAKPRSRRLCPNCCCLASLGAGRVGTGFAVGAWVICSTKSSFVLAVLMRTSTLASAGKCWRF